MNLIVQLFVSYCAEKILLHSGNYCRWLIICKYWVTSRMICMFLNALAKGEECFLKSAIFLIFKHTYTLFLWWFFNVSPEKTLIWSNKNSQHLHTSTLIFKTATSVWIIQCHSGGSIPSLSKMWSYTAVQRFRVKIFFIFFYCILSQA